MEDASKRPNLEDEDVEAHKKSSQQVMRDEGAQSEPGDSDDDVEAHKKFSAE